MTAELTEEFCVIKWDGCGAEARVTEANLVDFLSSWYQSIRRDFCPLCKTGKEAADDRAFTEQARAAHQKRLTRTAQSSH